ncbi:DUF2846 domain-containing protein [Pseudoxanthomonas sacheonensis]|uniref:DUF2846 domain-containing protein n=1 Tax=Pseudoxanthomonas sacheonensis TaxID=443615 RepID=A0ABU1RVQ6_9GAMM|nr:DUF2846 domain-containing protein [Pseudoxanthomonas sacheonensis]MDR6842861.1 hypothetical protein [Pseudoxanthomonas sacheonensis]
MRPMLHRSLLCLALACPAFAQAQTAAEPAPADSTAPADTATPAQEASEAVAATQGKIAPPPAGKGQIVFFREKKFAGSAIRYKVREGEAELGKLSSGTYFVHATDPGAHEYTVHSEAKDILNMEVEAGETYYVIGGVTMGLFAGHPNLSPSDQAVFDGMAEKLKPAKALE